MRLNACRLDNSFAISSGEEGADPSSSSFSPDKGICVDSGNGGGDGALSFGLVRVGLLLFADVGILSEDLLLWYFVGVGGEGVVFIEASCLL